MKTNMLGAALALLLVACGGNVAPEPPKTVMPPPVLCSSAPGSTEVKCIAWGK